MGDVLTGVFGGGSRTTAEQKPDATSQALNDLRLEQLRRLFGTASYSDFASSRPDIYTPSSETAQLYSDASNPDNISSLLDFEDYVGLGLDQTQNYISEIASPEILSNLALSGLESSGAAPEAIAKATASIGLPFVQGLPGASVALSRAPSEIRAIEAGRASTLFPLADFGRSLKEEDFLRQQGAVTTGLTGLPFTPGTKTSQRNSSQPLFNFFGQG